MTFANAAIVKVPRGKVLALAQRHMALGTIRLGHFRVVKRAGVMAADAAQVKRVVMILAAQEVLVVV